jgi:hypothetical protein
MVGQDLGWLVGVALGSWTRVVDGPRLELERATWQAGHMWRVNRPSTCRKGPWVVPQKEQCGPTPRLPLKHLFD